jgi:dTDP-4-dehydrorhamnose 3,5-epimerase
LRNIENGTGMNFQTFDIAGLIAMQPIRRGDARGYFAETFRADLFEEAVGDIAFVQENESLSAKMGTIRGLHFQTDPFAQGKLVRCIAGALLDVTVDIRTGSPTYGQWLAVELSAENGQQLWVPPGFAHGFCTLQPDTMLAYKVTAYYDQASDKGLAWNDSAIGIAWPTVADPDTLSPKDCVQPRLADLPAYFTYEG